MSLYQVLRMWYKANNTIPEQRVQGENNKFRTKYPFTRVSLYTGQVQVFAEDQFLIAIAGLVWEAGEVWVSLYI